MLVIEDCNGARCWRAREAGITRSQIVWHPPVNSLRIVFSSVISTTFAAHYFLFTPGGMPEGHAWNRYNPSVWLYIEHNRSPYQVFHAHS